jgi:hypothetical protein
MAKLIFVKNKINSTTSDNVLRLKENIFIKRAKLYKRLFFLSLCLLIIETGILIHIIHNPLK